MERQYQDTGQQARRRYRTSERVEDVPLSNARAVRMSR
jgi:hypothetical protein